MAASLLNSYVAQQRKDFGLHRVGRFPATVHQRPQFEILHVGQDNKGVCLRGSQARIKPIEELPQQQVHFQHGAASTAPAQAVEFFSFLYQIARRTIISLILPIARVGFRPFGQTSTQFMML